MATSTSARLRIRHFVDVFIGGQPAQVEIQIDVDGLAKLLARRLNNSKTGRATAVAETIVVKRVTEQPKGVE